MAYVGPSSRRTGCYCHEHWNPVGYPLLSSHYRYNVRSIFVEAYLTETYQAQTNTEREVSYIFEIPPEASVVEFFATVDGTQIRAIVDEKAEADRKYKAATSAGIEAWKLEKVHDEVFQISLGSIRANSTIEIRVTYVYVISSDTLEDSVRLTIPTGLAARPGTGPASETTVPTAPTGQNAVTITVGIQVDSASQIFGLASPSHHATITPGFADDSFKKMSPVQQQRVWQKSQAYVEFTSNQFLKDHFVLVWLVPRIDHAYCITEPLSPTMPGKPETFACALTLVSNIELSAEEQEFIFLVDRSGSMSGDRTMTANNVLREMLNQLPAANRATFNIYNFTTSASSILAGGKSVGYDRGAVADALSRLSTSASGGTSIDTALKTVLSQRDASKQRCSIIVLTDGLDWGVTAAMQTVQQNVATAAARNSLLRVFVMGLGDDVSRSMCEALARAGHGATAYINESLLLDHDHLVEKAKTVIRTIGRAPIRVLSVDWAMNPNPSGQSQGQASGNNLDSRKQPDEGSLGARAKGDNLPPPQTIQQAPLPKTMFWAIRSSWYAIINGFPKGTNVRITYTIPGDGHGARVMEVVPDQKDSGKLIHTLAARALIQTLEDKAANTTNTDDRYWDEAEIVRLGKTYGLASTQTSFIATRNGVGTRTNVRANASIQSRSLLAGVPAAQSPSLNFVGTLTPPPTPGTSGIQSFAAMSAFAEAPRMRLAMNPSIQMFAAAAPITAATAPSVAAPGDSDLLSILAAQHGDGSFDSSVVEQIVFPSTGTPEVAAFISSLDGRDQVKTQIWHATCVIAFFQKKHSERRSEWADAKAKAEKFVQTNLCCIFGVAPDQSESIFANSLNEAEMYFF